MTNAEKVQLLPSIAFSISSMMSLGKRIVLLVVGGMDGTLNFLIRSPRNTSALQLVLSERPLVYALQLYCNILHVLAV